MLYQVMQRHNFLPEVRQTAVAPIIDGVEQPDVILLTSICFCCETNLRSIFLDFGFAGFHDGLQGTLGSTSTETRIYRVNLLPPQGAKIHCAVQI